jgi:hypothetical protein
MLNLRLSLSKVQIFIPPCIPILPAPLRGARPGKNRSLFFFHPFLFTDGPKDQLPGYEKEERRAERAMLRETVKVKKETP